MTGLIILTFVPFIAAAFFLIRLRGEQKLRRQEQRDGALDRGRTGTDTEWNAVLGHELRSPIAAILGYQELIQEGTFGELPPAAADSLRRIGLAAGQLLLLVEAVERTAGSEPLDDPAFVRARDMCRDAIDKVRFDAEGRGTTITIADNDVELRTRVSDACRALLLVLGAAVKTSPGAILHVAAHDGTIPRITVSGGQLEPGRDDGAPAAPLTGAGLRLHLARAAARPAGGTVLLDPSGAVHLDLPRLP
jgi:signal transduction histidine kinase